MSSKPNILLITTDQQRFDTTGSKSPSFLRTPHMDHLAREGVSFTSAYSDCPICIPARVSIMTGKYAINHGTIGNYTTNGGLPIDRNTALPARMRSLGYQTAAIGKMHFKPMRARYGFEEMILPDDYYREMDKVQGVGKPMDHGLGQNELYPGMATVPESYTLTAWTVDKCVEYIQRRRDPQLPFFLWCSFSKPHPPLDPPEPYYSMYLDSPIPKPWLSEWSKGKECPEAFRYFREMWSLDLIPLEIIHKARAAYYGLITQIDYNMGRLFAGLQDLRIFDETVIIFTSDHGEFLGDHHTGGKYYAHEGSAHIPMILRFPPGYGDRPVGVENNNPVCLADILPTLISVAGGSPPNDIDGQDLTALAKGELENPRQWVGITAKNRTPDYFALVGNKWKYIYYFADGAEQFFDLKSDPHELNNLAYEKSHKDILNQLRDLAVEKLKGYRDDLVEDNGFVKIPLEDVGVARRRAKPWPGYHTTGYQDDVRH